MKQELNEVEINGVKYVKKGHEVPNVDLSNYFIIRTYSAGVFAGIIKKRKSETSVIMDMCRRIHYWDGAASLSQMAVSGVTKPSECRFSVRTSNHELVGVIEIIACTKEAAKNIEEVPEWKV
jgi:hypothetical protein